MILVQRIDVIFTVKAAVHHQLDFLVAEEIHICQQVLDGFNIRDIPGKLSVVEREVGLLTKKKGQIDLRKRVVILIDTELDLFDAVGITGYRGGVIRPVFLFYSAIALQAKELFRVSSVIAAKISLLRWGRIS